MKQLKYALKKKGCPNAIFFTCSGPEAEFLNCDD